MSLENITAKYTIQITRDGDGAALAVQDFKTVEEASKRLNQATAKSSDAVHELGNAAKLTKASMQPWPRARL